MRDLVAKVAVMAMILALTPVAIAQPYGQLSVAAVSQDSAIGPEESLRLAVAAWIPLSQASLFRVEAHTGGGDTSFGGALEWGIEGSAELVVTTGSERSAFTLGPAIRATGLTFIDARDEFGLAPGYALPQAGVTGSWRDQNGSSPFSLTELRLWWWSADKETGSEAVAGRLLWRRLRLSAEHWSPGSPIGPDGWSVALGINVWEIGR